ncbi:GATA transcription factor 17-like [Impatiens glandulifera]|uniref:GATA transcription factor 17-like n=1 Tax=Impatiens glandulifera TaxID=253017 RepID=UPI001FB13AB9|nr:GATA transcription factor 17-like [Impatiens glandulifera]
MDNTTTMIVDGDLSDGSCAKTCVDCGTWKTPLWRGGPAGPKSLCNACGIRSRKKRRAILGLNKGSSEKNEMKKRSKCSDDSLKKRRNLLALGTQVSWKRSRSSTAAATATATAAAAVEKYPVMKLGEVEQAAVLLMALSCGSVYF